MNVSTKLNSTGDANQCSGDFLTEGASKYPLQ